MPRRIPRRTPGSTRRCHSPAASTARPPHTVHASSWARGRARPGSAPSSGAPPPGRDERRDGGARPSDVRTTALRRRRQPRGSNAGPGRLRRRCAGWRIPRRAGGDRLPAGRGHLHGNAARAGGTGAAFGAVRLRTATSGGAGDGTSPGAVGAGRSASGTGCSGSGQRSAAGEPTARRLVVGARADELEQRHPPRGLRSDEQGRQTRRSRVCRPFSLQALRRAVPRPAPRPRVS